MSYLGIGSPIPVGRIVSSDSVLLSYASDDACQIGSTITPSQALPAGGTFTSNTLNTSFLNSSNGSITLNSNTPIGNHVIKYTVGGSFATFSLQIKAMEDATFTYSGTGSNPIIISAGSGSLSPTETSSYTTDTYTSSPNTSYINSQGVIDTDNLDIGVPYDITRNTGGDCSQSSTVKIQTQATSINRVANNFAMEFNGTDEYVSANYSSIFNQSVYSFSLWIKNSQNNVSSDKGILCADTSGSRGFALQQNGQKLKWDSNISGGSSQLLDADFFNTTAIWIHCIVTYDGSNLKMYKNGQLQETVSSGTSNMNPNSNNLTIGNNPFATGRFFSGDLDEVALFNKALSLSEIQLIYNATINNPGETANLFTAGLNNSLVYWNRMGD